MNGFRNLLAALILFQHNVKILHWNAIGLDFDPVHDLLGDYYKQLDEFVDDVAEMGIQLNIEPVGLMEAVQLLNESDQEFLTLEGKDIFDSEEVFTNLENMFEKLISLYEATYADTSVPADIINKLQEHSYWIRKQSAFKNKRRLRNS